MEIGLQKFLAGEIEICRSETELSFDSELNVLRVLNYRAGR